MTVNADRMRFGWPRFLVGMSSVAVCAIALACAPAQDSDTPSVLEVITIEPDVTIGLVEGDSAYLFGEVVSVASDGAGRVYVGDRIGATVRVYDSSGRFLKQIAREGSGPGEIYGWPADLTSRSDGRLYIGDGSRVTIFIPSEPGGVADSVAAIWALASYGNLSSTRSGLGGAGEYLYPGYLFYDGQLPRFFYLPFLDGTPTGDTLEVPPYPMLAAHRRATYRLGAVDRRMLTGLSHVPFAPLPAWDVTQAGSILSSSGSENVLIETGIAGDTIRTITGPTFEPREIPVQERGDSLRALNVRLDSLPVPINQVIGLGEGVQDRRLPTMVPAIVRIHVASDGSIWIERWPREGQAQARFYDVLESDGRLRARVVLRAPLIRDPPPFFGSAYVVGVVRDSDTGVERVVRFAIPSQPER